MSEAVRRFLIRSRSKVVGHYRQLLDSPSLRDSDRENISQRLAQPEKELDELRRPPTAGTSPSIAAESLSAAA